ncbi:hypothetical protein EPN18_07370 [bacterium]|nr:MAG: hypothetical protein EPN18_07370 [bacterium]
MLENKAIMLAKIEGTYGTDAAPTPTANAILCSAPQIEIIGKAITRNQVIPYYGALAKINIGEGIKVSFEVEVRGAGAVPSTPPRIGALLRACNFTETIDATPGAEFSKYDPNSLENGESVTIYFYRDGVLHKVLGCVGAFKLSAKLNEQAKIAFTFTGLYAGTHASDTAFPSPTFGDAVLPPIFRQAAFSIIGYSADIEKLTLDVANDVKPKKSVNGTASGVSRYFVANRAVKGDCDPAAVALATFNPWAQFDASTAGALSATIGSAAQNRLIVTMPNVIPDTPKYATREGIVAYGYPFTAHPTMTTGNNELSLKFN